MKQSVSYASYTSDNCEEIQRKTNQSIADFKLQFPSLFLNADSTWLQGELK